jgi:hypothetical protein
MVPLSLKLPLKESWYVSLLSFSEHLRQVTGLEQTQHDVSNSLYSLLQQQK